MTYAEGTDFVEALLTLLHRLEALKHLQRTGWVDRQVLEPESVAAHSWRLALLSWIIADLQGLDAERAMQLALVHDIPEAVTGDRTPFDDLNLSRQDRLARAAEPDPTLTRTPEQQRAKHERERQALLELLAGVPQRVSSTLQDAWDDYERGLSAEARLVKQLDKLEAYVQGCEYARSGRLAQPKTLNSFRLDNERMLTDPLLLRMLQATEP